MNRLRVLIVDDEPLAREGVALLLREDPEVEIVGECDDGGTALAEIRARRPDLVLLDIQMPQRSGLELLERLEADERPAIVFITAYDEHAVRAFELCAVDYLLKPFRDQRFRSAIARAKEQVRRASLHEVQRQAQSLIDHLRRLEGAADAGRGDPAAPAGRLVLKAGGEHVFLEPASIAWIEAQGDFIKVRTGGQVLLTRESLQNIERRLEGGPFVRVHRSFIVNSTCISKIIPALYGDHVVLMKDGTKIRLSRTYRESLKRLLAAPDA